MAGLPNQTKQRGKVLTGWLILIILGNAWAAFQYSLIIKPYIYNNVDFTETLKNLNDYDRQLLETLQWSSPIFIILQLVNIGAIILLFLWRKLGFYIFALSSNLTYLIGVMLGMYSAISSMSTGIGVWVGIAILWLLLKPHWQDFS